MNGDKALNNKNSLHNSLNSRDIHCSTVTVHQLKATSKDSLIKLKPLRKMVECALISPYIKAEKPLSLLIVAKAESGKTSAMKLYRLNKGIMYVSDCTAYGLTRDVLPKMISGEIKTIMIPDLITPLSKSAKTRQSFIAFLNNLIEEGVAKITTYAMVWDRDVKANVITAVTDEAIADARHDWAKMGFVSRFIIFSYSYRQSVIMDILQHYSSHPLGLDQNSSVPLPQNEIDIDLPRGIAKELDPYAIRIGEELQLYGIRAKINFRCLLKCLAYRNGKNKVTKRELREFVELADFMNFKYNQI